MTELLRNMLSPLPAPPSPPAGNMWAARCDYIAKLHPPAGLRAAVEPAVLDWLGSCPAYFLGTERFAAEFWVVSHPAAVVHDLLPPRAAIGDPILFVWAYRGVPEPHAWAPAPARVPRPGLAASTFVNAVLNIEFGPRLLCARASLRARQYRAAYGGAALERLPAAGVHCAWLRLVTAGFGPHDTAWPVEEYVRDAAAHSRPGCGMPE